MSRDDGGPVHPCAAQIGPMVAHVHEGQAHYAQSNMIPGSRGISLRDHFAGQALQGLIAEPECEDVTNNLVSLLSGGGDKSGVAGLAGRYAEAAYLLADAMLKERAKP